MKVGDYVRSNDGFIGKITEDVGNGDVYIDRKNIFQMRVKICEEDIKKIKPNIIELLEVGDYVNGHLVFDKAPNCVYIEDNQNKMAHIPYTKDNIESVLTKEQFESMEYMIGE